MNWITRMFESERQRTSSRHINAGSVYPSKLDRRVARRLEDRYPDITEDFVSDVRRALFVEIARKVDRGFRVVLTGFATFWITRRSARTMKLPSGRTIAVPERDIPQCTFSKPYKDWCARPGPAPSHDAPPGY